MAAHRMDQGGLPAVLAGAAYVPRGIALFLRTPGVRLLGVLPVLLAGLLALVLLVLLALVLDDLAGALTPFADRWSGSARTLARVGVGLVLLLGYGLVVAYSFVAITQVIGQPFYERVSARIEAGLGGAPPSPDARWWRTFPRATVESVALFILVLVCTAPLLALGLVPVLGQTVIPVVAALVSGFFLSIELLAIPLERRGLRLGQRLRFAWRYRATVAGFGLAAFLLFLVPLMNVVALPGAIAGGTLLVRRLAGDAQPAAGMRRPPRGFQPVRGPGPPGNG